MQTFEKVVLFTDTDGYAKFRTEKVPLTEGTPEVRLSREFAARELQLRESPVGFRSPMHCTVIPQWLFVLSGAIEIGLADGSTRQFNAGEHFYSADKLPQKCRIFFARALALRDQLFIGGDRRQKVTFCEGTHLAGF